MRRYAVSQPLNTETIVYTPMFLNLMHSIMGVSRLPITAARTRPDRQRPRRSAIPSSSGMELNDLEAALPAHDVGLQTS